MVAICSFWKSQMSLSLLLLRWHRFRSTIQIIKSILKSLIFLGIDKLNQILGLLTLGLNVFTNQKVLLLKRLFYPLLKINLGLLRIYRLVNEFLNLNLQLPISQGLISFVITSLVSIISSVGWKLLLHAS